jgi:diguanylate cyclase (GGDEF)-like protein
MSPKTESISASGTPARAALIGATARLLAKDLSLDEIFKKVASLLDDVFDTASVEIVLAGDAPRKFRYGVKLEFELGSSIDLPLRFHESEIGNLRVVRKTGRQFSAADRECLETFALSIAAHLHAATITSEKDHYATLAGIDPLTGIPSRREFTARYEAEWSRGVRQGGLLSVIMIDVDYFKQYNDHHGHIAGDSCLHMVAQILTRCISRPGDSVARYGGEEFAVILPQTDNAGAVALAEKMRSAIAAQRIAHDGASLALVTVSIGVATQTPLQSSESSELLEMADMALYSAKQAGRNMVVGDRYRTDEAHAGKPPIQSNLPEKLTSFFGRAAELDAIEYLSAQTRALTITGIAGIGKTRVALQTANREMRKYPDGVWFIDLARVTDAALVVGSVMYVLGQSEEQGKQPAATLIERIGSRRLLIVLDNCQRLIEECAALAESLLRKCPNVSVMATCREPLGIAGEIAYRIPPLAFHDAADLFISRASTINPKFKLRNEDRMLVERTVARLGGIPMAIELAAARIKMMTVAELDARLVERFPVLLPGGDIASSREHILPALVDWSYIILDDEEKRLLRRLAVFPGDFTIEASASICIEREEEKRAELAVLSRLVDKAFLLDEHHGDEDRYDMFETLRDYCRRMMQERNEVNELQHRHSDYYLQLATRLEQKRSDMSTTTWKSCVEIEIHNFRAALEWSVLGGGDLVVGTSIAVELAAWWAETSHFSEGRYWLDHIIWRTNDGKMETDLHGRLFAAAGLIGSRQAGATNGHATNGHATNGHATNGHATNGHSANAHASVTKTAT